MIWCYAYTRAELRTGQTGQLRRAPLFGGPPPFGNVLLFTHKLNCPTADRVYTAHSRAICFTGARAFGASLPPTPPPPPPPPAPDRNMQIRRDPHSLESTRLHPRNRGFTRVARGEQPISERLGINKYGVKWKVIAFVDWKC